MMLHDAVFNFVSLNKHFDDFHVITAWILQQQLQGRPKIPLIRSIRSV